MHLIVAALIEEVSGIVRGGRYQGPRPLGNALLYRSNDGASPATAIVVSGSGADAATKATSAAIEELQPDSIISTGFAGATRDSLMTGNLVLATELYRLEGAPFFWDRERMNGPIVPDQGLLSLARSAVEMAGVDFHLGTLVTLPTIAKTSGMKKWLGGKIGATAVDMESFAVGLVARDAEIPFLTVRAIVDSASLDLPDVVGEVSQAPSGNRLLPALRHIARRPDHVPQLVKLGKAAAKARSSIAVFMSYLLAELAREEATSADRGEAA